MKRQAFLLKKRVVELNRDSGTDGLSMGSYRPKRAVWVIIVFLLIQAGCEANSGRKSGQAEISKHVSFCLDDLNGDGRPETLFLTPDKNGVYGRDLVILPGMKDSGKTHGGEVYRHSFETLKPWKVQTSDVDGDGKREISIGVMKKARFHPVEAKRPFIYEWQDGYISPKWLGSRLARPMEDYIFVNIDGDSMEELISVELEANGRKAVNAYKWTGFGFESVGQSRDFAGISELRRGNNSASLVEARASTEDGKWKWVEIEFAAAE